MSHPFIQPGHARFIGYQSAPFVHAPRPSFVGYQGKPMNTAQRVRFFGQLPPAHTGESAGSAPATVDPSLGMIATICAVGAVLVVAAVHERK